MPKSEEVSGMSNEQLIAILKELRKPVKTEKEIREERDYEDARAASMQTIKQDEANKELTKQNCSHMRPNGSTSYVYVDCVDRLYCQVCQNWLLRSDPATWNRFYPLAVG